MSFEVKKWIHNHTHKKINSKKGSVHYDVFFILKKDKESLISLLKKLNPSSANGPFLEWQLHHFKSVDLPFYSFQVKTGFIYICVLPTLSPSAHTAEVSLLPTEYASARDFCGILLRSIKEVPKETSTPVHVHFDFLNTNQMEGILTGLEMGGYNFKQKNLLPHFLFFKNGTPFSIEPFQKALLQGHAVNTARHLVNLPPNELNPENYAQWFSKEWKNEKNWTVEILNHDRLKKEGYSLLLAVGNSALSPPCLVHLKYRGDKNPKAPTTCFIGKGITFDSGGLDIKPSSGMRLMKKDMGGAACLSGLALFLKQVQWSINCDFYFALAENAVDEKAFRPGDIYFAKNGLSIEISNTDAEGRLVLADAMICAQLQNKNIKALIDVSTLTGAGKVALGPDVASLFSNNKELCEKLKTAATESGDPCWHMPLVTDYAPMLQSPFADLVNSSESSYAGAITAALFLNRFVENATPWAHFDIFAWQEASKGPFLERGGSGQTTQCLINYLEKISTAD